MAAAWFLMIITIIFIFLIISFISRKKKNNIKRIPPGPPAIPLIGNLPLLAAATFAGLEHLLRRLRAAYGPIVTLHVGRTPAIFIMDPELIRTALVIHGDTFAFRPPSLAGAGAGALGANLNSINDTTYGPLWRLLRSNLASTVLSPSRFASYLNPSSLAPLLKKLSGDGGVVGVVDDCCDRMQRGVFGLMFRICFGEDEELDEEAVREVQGDLLEFAVKLSVFNLLPKSALLLFLPRWRKLVEIRRRQKDLLIPIITRRLRCRRSVSTSYIDSLLHLRVDDDNEESGGGRALDMEELVNLCSEFLNAGTETTSTALQWIMANLVKRQEMQERLAKEIAAEVVAEDKSVVRVDDLREMHYLKAVVLEGLRRHPPAHFLLPHTVAEDTTIAGYLIPRGAVVNCPLAFVGLDEGAWEDPMEFNPERFVDGGVVEAGDGWTTTMKMAPFGAGRRICPGMGFATVMLQYFVANLVHAFRWEEVEGKEVELAEKPGMVFTMKHPFSATLTPRNYS